MLQNEPSIEKANETLSSEIRYTLKATGLQKHHLDNRHHLDNKWLDFERKRFYIIITSDNLNTEDYIQKFDGINGIIQQRKKEAENLLKNFKTHRNKLSNGDPHPRSLSKLF